MQEKERKRKIVSGFDTPFTPGNCFCKGVTMEAQMETFQK